MGLSQPEAMPPTLSVLEPLGLALKVSISLSFFPLSLSPSPSLSFLVLARQVLYHLSHISAYKSLYIPTNTSY
jgi:hypothetical protein